MIQTKFTFKKASFLIYDDDVLVKLFDDRFWDLYLNIKYELSELIESKAVRIKDSKELIIDMDVIYESLCKQNDYDEDNPTFSKLLSPELLKFLEIPTVSSGTLILTSKYTTVIDKFKVFMFYKATKKGQEVEIINSPLVKYNNKEFLIGNTQNKACGIIRAHKAHDNIVEDNSFLIGRIKRLAKLGDIVISEGMLKSEEIEYVESIRPKLSLNRDGSVDLGFDIESGNGDELEQLVQKGHDKQEIYTKPGRGRKRKRYVLSKSARKAVKTYRKKNHFEKKERIKLYEEQENLFEGFNLDDYGDRVIGIGRLFVPKPIPATSSGVDDWLGEISINPVDPSHHPDDNIPEVVPKIKPKNPEEFLREIENAEESGEEFLEVELVDGTTGIIDIRGRIPQLKEWLKGLIKKNVLKCYLIVRSNIDENQYNPGVNTEFLNNVTASLKGFNAYKLKDYQLEGLQKLCTTNLRGILLADDMGLGKTMQVCAFMASLMRSNKLRTSLLVVPPILAKDWVRELKKTMPSIKLFNLFEKIGSVNPLKGIDNSDVVICSYQKLLNKTMQLEIAKYLFKVIICDEVQHIKNPAARSTHAVLSLQSEFNIALTGTPIENSISELWSILDFVCPSYLPPLREFNKEYDSRGITKEMLEARIKKLQNRLKHIVIRRTKKDVLNNLPKKYEEPYPNPPVICIIDNEQVELYKRLAQQFKSGNMNFLDFVQKSVMVLSNPKLLTNSYGVAFSTKYESPKLKKTLEILDGIKEKNEKVLIFADRLNMQTLLKKKIDDKYGLSVNIINGKTLRSKRQQYCKGFEFSDASEKEDTGFDVLILSPKCAGFGLNLTKANHVIHYTRGYNPAVENQATDRIHRINQKKDCHIYNLVATAGSSKLKFTIEEKLHEIIGKKKKLLDNYLYTAWSKINMRELAESMDLEYEGMSIKEVDSLTWEEFEILIKVLYEKMGYGAEITPKSGDQGADVVAVGSGSEPNALIQVKHKESFDSSVSNKAIQEVVAAKNVYEKQYNVSFDKLVVATNGNYSEQAIYQAKVCNVDLINRNSLRQLLDKYKVTEYDFISQTKQME